MSVKSLPVPNGFNIYGKETYWQVYTRGGILCTFSFFKLSYTRCTPFPAGGVHDNNGGTVVIWIHIPVDGAYDYYGGTFRFRRSSHAHHFQATLTNALSLRGIIYCPRPSRDHGVYVDGYVVLRIERVEEVDLQFEKTYSQNWFGQRGFHLIGHNNRLLPQIIVQSVWLTY